jgi:endonuclease/exonuclease/phosphatase (EEP) superfamily protein YafD
MKTIIQSFKTALNFIIQVFAWSVPLLALGVWFLPHTYFFAILRSVSPQIAMFALVAVVYFLFRNKTSLFLSTYAGLLLLIPVFLDPVLPDALAEKKSAQQNISFAQFNVLKFNSAYDNVSEQALASGADIISFQEVDTAWDKNLREKLTKQYPYVISYPTEWCCFGVALFSKRPLKNEHIEFLGGVPNIVADVNMEGQLIHVVSVHTSSPIVKQNFVRRNQHLLELTKYLSQVKNPKIVLGDFNSVPWDVYLNEFKTDTKLLDSRHSYVATYPSWLGRFGIPIDYIFHSDDIVCTSFLPLHSTSSDHHGVKGEYRFKSSGLAQNR